MRHVFFFTLLFTAYPLTAHAYINPEVGSMLYQSIIGGIIAGGAIWRFCGKWIRDVIKKFR